VNEDSTPATFGKPRWEYRQFLATPAEELMQSLATEAQEGWELVCVTVEEPYFRAFLKRRTASKEPS